MGPKFAILFHFAVFCFVLFFVFYFAFFLCVCVLSFFALLETFLVCNSLALLFFQIYIKKDDLQQYASLSDCEVD